MGPRSAEDRQDITPARTSRPEPRANGPLGRRLPRSGNTRRRTSPRRHERRPTATPRMISIENLAELGSVGVPQPCCTTEPAVTAISAASVPRRSNALRREARLCLQNGGPSKPLALDENSPEAQETVKRPLHVVKTLQLAVGQKGHRAVEQKAHSLRPSQHAHEDHRSRPRHRPPPSAGTLKLHGTTSSHHNRFNDQRKRLKSPVCVRQDVQRLATSKRLHCELSAMAYRA